MAQADILTFHTPLNKSGPYTTLHLMDETRLSAMKDNGILINASRGAVVDNRALLSVLAGGKPLSVVLDVWEPEPDLSTELLSLVDIGTPHIAGYTRKARRVVPRRSLKPLRNSPDNHSRLRCQNCYRHRNSAVSHCQVK